jgi:putative tryptophan/tyrosine transport system substrate-binding protein
MRRREFIAGLGAAATWPLVAAAQRRVGVLIHLSESQPTGQRYVAAFRQGLKELGWTDGDNVRIDVRWIAGDPERLRPYAAELVALDPDVVLASYTPGVLALQRTNRRVPTVRSYVQKKKPWGPAGKSVRTPAHGGGAQS